jgi:hypothetical protein
MDRKNKEKQLINKRWKTAQIQQELGFEPNFDPFSVLLLALVWTDIFG